jgi:diguanylate cyclase (GGDEF)-like protein/PAS domain S-box-containing protein
MSRASSPVSLRRVILIRWSLLVLGTALLFCLAFVIFGLRPVVERIADEQFSRASMQVERRLDETFAPARTQLRMARLWLDGVAPDLEDPTEFNRYFMPVLKALPQATSVVAGTSTGQAWLLLQQADDRWRNRMTDLPRWGPRHRIIEHAPDGSRTSHWSTLSYDARMRPWYRAALSPAKPGRPEEPGAVRWTEPYLFFTTGDPGITASTRLRLKDGRDLVLGLDLMLRDLSEATMSSRVGLRGTVLVVTSDWRVLALPARPPQVSDSDWTRRILRPISELGLPSLDRLRAVWQQSGQPDTVFRYQAGTTSYMATVHRYTLADQRYFVVSLAPSADFVPEWRPVALALFLLLVAISLVGVMVAGIQARAIARPLESLAQASERIGQLDFAEPPPQPCRINEIRQLEAAQSAMRTLLRQNQNDLAARVAALQDAEARIADSERYNKVLFADSRIPLVVLDPETGRFVDCNQAAVEIYRMDRRESVLGLTPLDVSAACQYDGRTSVELAREHVALALEHGSRVFEWRHRRPDGSEWDAEVYLMTFGYNGRTLIQFSLQDITERKGAEDKLQRLAFYDTLTGLPNRALLLDRLGQALAQAQRHEHGVALFYLDLDRFKEVNDTQGHSVGDRVLQEAARRFHGVLRQDESMARMGGDEFVVLAMDADQVAAARIAERLIATLAVPIEVAGHQFSMAASVGIVLYPEDGRTPEDLLQHADVAMYRAKTSGGGYRFYRPEMSDGLAERMAMARDLKSTLRQHGGELSLHYQPLVNLASGRLVGAEALMRWRSPEHGEVSPAVFIPLAEERSMMAELGAWVIEEACRQLNTWQAQGHPLPGRLAVNIATQQIERADFPEQAVAIVRRAGLSPEAFDLELTESGLMRNVELAINIAGRLKAAGFALSIDDFGTGYSSLAYLKRLPVGKMKIDMSFVRDMLDDHNDYAIVNTIIGMGHTLDMKTLAEGVETPAQAETLLAMGCLEGQGYHFGRPESGAAFAARWLVAPAG